MNHEPKDPDRPRTPWIVWVIYVVFFGGIWWFTGWQGIVGWFSRRKPPILETQAS